MKKYILTSLFILTIGSVAAEGAKQSLSTVGETTHGDVRTTVNTNATKSNSNFTELYNRKQTGVTDWTTNGAGYTYAKDDLVKYGDKIYIALGAHVQDVTTPNSSVDFEEWAGGGTGSVSSVNTQTGDVVLDADDISDTTTTNKFVTSAEKTKLSNLSGTNTGDQDLSDLATKANVLQLNNTTAFTPDADYEPATKKYVDEAVTAGGGYTDEMAQDAVGGMFSGNTETGITVTYDDATGKVNFVVTTQFDGTQNTTGSAAKLTTARTIGGVSFDGSANINLPGVNQSGTQNTSGTAAGLGAQYIDWSASSGGTSIANKPSIAGLETSGITGNLTLTKTGTTARTATFPDAAGTVALTSDIPAAVTDATITTTDVTTNNATTSKHGWLVKATAPASGLRNVVAIDNGETVYTNKALFDATSPSTQAFGDSAAVGSAITAARRDHKHAMPAAQTATTTAFTPNGSIAATTVQAAIQEVRDEAGGGVSLSVANTWTAEQTFSAGVKASNFTSTALDGARYSEIPNTVALTSTATLGRLAWLTDRFWLANGTNWTSRWLLDSSMIGASGGVQAYDADLGTYAGITPSANVQSLLGAANYAAIKTLLDTDDIQTLTGIAAGTAHLGTFTGTTIADNTTIKTALQSLETAVESASGGGLTTAQIDTSSELRTIVGDEKGTGALLFDGFAATEVDGSAAGSLTAAQVSGTIVTNRGQAASDVALTLPTAAAGYNALFTVGTAQTNKWGVRAGTNDKIYLLAADGTISAGSDNGYARMTAAQVGQAFACWTFQTGSSTWDWQCKASAIGTSTFAAN